MSSQMQSMPSKYSNNSKSHSQIPAPTYNIKINANNIFLTAPSFDNTVSNTHKQTQVIILSLFNIQIEI
jgi:hypothetical protein